MNKIKKSMHNMNIVSCNYAVNGYAYGYQILLILMCKWKLKLIVQFLLDLSVISWKEIEKLWHEWKQVCLNKSKLNSWTCKNGAN